MVSDQLGLMPVWRCSGKNVCSSDRLSSSGPGSVIMPVPASEAGAAASTAFARYTARRPKSQMTKMTR